MWLNAAAALLWLQTVKTEEVSMSFHQRLKHERLIRGWTIEQLSQASGVTVNRIALLERNLVEMVSDSLKDCLAQALKVDFAAPPSAALDAVQEPLSAPVQSIVTELPTGLVVQEPLALHLGAKLQQQLEAAAHTHGRSLHGEVLARLEASLIVKAGESTPVAQVSSAIAPAQDMQPSRNDVSGVVQLSEADLARITEQVALRLQSRH